MHLQYDVTKIRHHVTDLLIATARLALRRLRVIAMLVLVIASVSQTLQAKAAPAATEYAYFGSASMDRGNATICVGDNVLISVKVERVKIENTDLSNWQSIAGIRVEGLVQDPSIGNYIMPNKYTGMSSDRPGIAVFAFHANKAGATALTFRRPSVITIVRSSNGCMGRPCLPSQTRWR